MVRRAALIALGTWLVFCAAWLEFVRRHWQGWVWCAT